MARVGPRVGIGLLGCGVVGSAFVRAMADVSEGLDLVAVAVRDVAKPRNCSLAGTLLTDEAGVVVDHPDVDVVVEVIGGIDDAGRLIGRALASGKPVVTANKAVLGAWGPELRATAADHGVPLLFEAAVAGAVPVIRGMAGLLRSDKITKVEGLLNGTTTFVLSHIERMGATLEEAVAEAQRLGYAEADATRDLDGTDAADKLAVLAQYLFGDDVRTDDVHRFGIDRLRPEDLAPRPDGSRWRLLAKSIRGQCARVEPILLRPDHPFAQVAGAQCALTITGERSGAITLVGAGAGGDPTAASVLADLIGARDRLMADGALSAVGTPTVSIAE